MDLHTDCNVTFCEMRLLNKRMMSTMLQGEWKRRSQYLQIPFHDPR